MKVIFKIIGIGIILLLKNVFQSNANDFSSFLTANASLAIVIDEEFTRQRGEDIFAQIQITVDDIVRKNIENGGVNVRYYTWGYVRLKKDFVAAVIVSNCKNTWKFFEMTKINSILLLAITEANCPRLPINEAIMIPVIAKGDEIPQLLLDIKLQSVLNWKSCILLFDNSVESEATQIVKSLTYTSPRSLFNPIALQLFKIDGQIIGNKQQRRNTIKDAMLKYKYHRGIQFIIFTEIYDEIVDIALSLDMFNVFNQWLFFFPKNTDTKMIYSYTDRLNEGANIAYAINSTVAECQEKILCSVTEVIFGFVIGLSKVIDQESALYGQISDEEWEAIRLTKKERQNEILLHIKYYLNFKSKCSGCSKWILKSMESWGRSGKYEHDFENFEDAQTSRYFFNEVGHWNPMSGFITQDVLFPHVDHKFRNLLLNILTFDNKPWQNIVSNEKGEVVEADGLIIEILKELSLKLNFTYKLHSISINDEHHRNTNITNPLGPTTNLLNPKLIYTMNDQKFFMIAAGLTIDEYEKLPFNFTVPVSIQKYTFISQRPGEVSRMYLFTAPFQLNTWACLLCVIIITAPTLYLINKYAALQIFSITGLNKVENCFWYVYGALLQQGGMYLPKADSGRVVVGIWWVVVIVLVTTYCGNLVAFLTFPRFEAGNNYLADIFRHKEVITFGLRNGSFFAKQAKYSTRNDIRHYVERATLYSNTNEEDIQSVLHGKRTNIDWKINLQLRIQKDFDKYKICNFILGKEDFMDEKIGLILPPQSPYLELINDEIIRLHKMGFIEKWHKKYFPANDRCTSGLQSRQIVNHMVNLNDMQGCFLVLLLGFLLSALVICFEILVHHIKAQKIQNKFIE